MTGPPSCTQTRHNGAKVKDASNISVTTLIYLEAKIMKEYKLFKFKLIALRVSGMKSNNGRGCGIDVERTGANQL